MFGNKDVNVRRTAINFHQLKNGNESAIELNKCFYKRQDLAKTYSTIEIKYKFVSIAKKGLLQKM
jgi:hypothetical protein